jgi:hypothetical protein
LTRQERAQLANMEAQHDLAGINYGRARQLLKEGVIAGSDYDNASAQQKATEAQIGDIRATIARKTIRVPFSGALILAQTADHPKLRNLATFFLIPRSKELMIQIGMAEPGVGKSPRPRSLIRISHRPLAQIVGQGNAGYDWRPSGICKVGAGRTGNRLCANHATAFLFPPICMRVQDGTTMVSVRPTSFEVS